MTSILEIFLEIISTNALPIITPSVFNFEIISTCFLFEIPNPTHKGKEWILYLLILVIKSEVIPSIFFDIPVTP